MQDSKDFFFPYQSVLWVILLTGFIIVSYFATYKTNLLFEKFGNNKTAIDKLIAENPVDQGNLININQASKHKASSANGTSDVPVKKCSNGICSIDFGDYILNGIPENYNELVETTGDSGLNNSTTLKDEDFTKAVDKKINLDKIMDLDDLIFINESNK